uniref:Translocated promoter region a, nuclear basket protein n=1 Tax=Dicentrarchus labrax TaxID=13489 RepID=A0A8P4G4M7_DICLA
MAAVLLQVLERTELNKLPKGAQNKLEKFVTELQNANEALKTQHERFKADSEQQYFDIEKRLAESQEQILSATRDLQTLKEENKKLSEFLQMHCLHTLSLSGSTLCYKIQAEKRELARLLEKRTQEVENLTEDVKRLNEKLTETSKVKMELQLKLDDIQSSEASVQHREKRMEQEKELLENKIEWLSAELKTKTEELLNTNREKGKEILELQGSLNNNKEQVTNKQYPHRVRLCNGFQSLRLWAKDERTAMEEKYRNELNAHVKLSSLYKGAAADMETKNQELNRAVEELSKLVKDTGEANKTLEKKVSEGEELKTKLEAELREKIKKMEKELENATMKAAGALSLTEEQLDSMCPSAAAIAAIVKPGMKFFDLYNAYAECQTQLQLEKQETRRVSRVLDEIVQEVESKAPVLKRQREEYESMQRSMASLCNKLEQARMVRDSFILQKEKEEAKQLCDRMERDKLRTERQLEDTSTQVCALLVDLEEARGNQVTKDDSSSANISSTSEVTSTRQLSFHSVEELQRQNQSLLGRLMELEEEKDRQQKLEASVDKLQKEVEQLREQRNQLKQLADSSARQRDMYKALLTQSTGFSLPPQGPEFSSQPAHVRPSVPATRSTPQRAAAAESVQTAQAKAALKQLNDAFTLYKKEKAENDRMLNETNDKLQKQLTELRSSHAKLTSQLEFSNKRYEMLQETVSAYRREISAIQARSQKMAATAQRHEHIIHTMSQDLRQASEKLALEEVRVGNLTKERDMLRQAESRLSREKEAMLAEQRNQNLLLTNLKTIQLTMERTETDSRQRLNNKVEQLEAELASMKTRLDQEVAQRHSLGRTMDAQLLEAKKQLETQNTLQQKTRELLRTSEQQVTALKAQLASASSSEAVTASSNTGTPQELIEVKGLLRTAEERNGELAEQLKNANASVEQYRAVVLTLEDSLKKEKESRSPLEIRLKESEEVQKQLEKRILEVEKLKQQEQEQKRKAVEEVEKQVCELQRILKDSQAEQREALERATAAVTLEQKAIQDSLLQTKLAGEAQAKYERELMLHAADVEALQELKKRYQQEAAQKRELEERLNKASSLLQEKTAGWNTEEKQLKEDLSNKSHRCAELGKQNALLHQQMDEMATRSLNPNFVFTKEIAVAQSEASEGEALRHKQRVEHLDREVKDLQEALNAEREKMTLAQQEEQLKKMETISALQETNRMLKMDRDKLEQELLQAQAKVTKLQSDISPLHHSLSQLSERNGSLQADKRILEEDLKRLKAKTQQLISQQKDGDVEERQKIATEREAQQRRTAQLAEETAKLKTELASASSNSAQSQLQALRDSVARLTADRDALKKDLETKNTDILEKNKTITQVKKIGRRYKTQYEELKAQHDKLSEGKNREEQLRQQMAEKEEKTKKVFMGAKTKISQLNSAKEQLSQEIEELKQNKEELEVRMNALKSQYEGRFLRLDRELRELKETQAHSDPREEPQDQSGAKVGDQARSADQRPISLKSPAQDRGSSSLSDPPTANIRPTPSTPSPSNKPSPAPGSKATPRASIRPMVTPATVPIPTPTATVMPTTQTDSQEVLMSAGASVHSTSSGLVSAPTSITQPTSTQATAFVQPTQQQAANQDAGPSIEIERPSTSSSLIGTGEQGLVPKPTSDAYKEEEEDDEDEDDAGDSGMREGDDSNESREAEGDGGEEEPTEINLHFEITIVTHSSLPGEGSSSATSECDPPRDPVHLAPTPSFSSAPSPSPSPSSSHTPRLPHPRRPPHPLPPRLYIQPPAPELGPPHTQVHTHTHTHNDVFVLQQHFFDDDDRMVPSTPTLVVPHRTDGFAEAIHSPQVAGLSTRFRFGPPEDLLPQTSASHSDLGQLASQGGLGMYESPLFLAAHDEDGGGRSVPTTPLQVAAPVTVFTESLPSDSGDNMASQSVPMVTASTGMASAADDGDEVFMEQEGEGPGIESSLESQTDMESTGQQSDDASLPSTSQEPGNLLFTDCNLNPHSLIFIMNPNIQPVSLCSLTESLNI